MARRRTLLQEVRRDLWEVNSWRGQPFNLAWESCVGMWLRRGCPQESIQEKYGMEATHGPHFFDMGEMADMLVRAFADEDRGISVSRIDRASSVEAL